MEKGKRAAEVAAAPWSEGAGPVLLRATGLCVDLPGEKGPRRAVDEATFELEAGAVYDLVGRSGSGKSTLIRACARMVGLSGGVLELEGRDACAVDPCTWRTAVCLVPQKPALVAGTVRDNLLLPWRFGVRKGLPVPDEGRMADLLADALLGDVGLDRDTDRLSGGQAARVALLRCLLCDLKVLLLDEVDAALDDESARAVGVLIARAAQRGAAVLRVRHRSADGLAQRTFEMDGGRMVR